MIRTPEVPLVESWRISRVRLANALSESGDKLLQLSNRRISAHETVKIFHRVSAVELAAGVGFLFLYGYTMYVAFGVEATHPEAARMIKEEARNLLIPSGILCATSIIRLFSVNNISSRGRYIPLSSTVMPTCARLLKSSGEFIGR